MRSTEPSARQHTLGRNRSRITDPVTAAFATACTTPGNVGSHTLQTATKNPNDASIYRRSRYYQPAIFSTHCLTVQINERSFRSVSRQNNGFFPLNALFRVYSVGSTSKPMDTISLGLLLFPHALLSEPSTPCSCKIAT